MRTHFQVPVLFFGLMVGILSCQNQTDTASSTSANANIAPITASDAEIIANLKTHCFSCHSTDHSSLKIAPDFLEIKEKYIQKHPASADFAAAITDFSIHPTPEKSLFQEAVVQYGLMPKSMLEEVQLQNIGNFLFKTDLSQPAWFQPASVDSVAQANKSPLEKGKDDAMRTKGVLGKNLLAALQKGKTAEALAFCSGKAQQLTDSMSLVLGVEIKRVSDKNRNAKNTATTSELQYIELAKAQIAANKKPSPQIQTLQGQQVAYYPIVAENMCLQCHGKINTDISAATYAEIQKFYPNDKAIGYNIGDLRGIWVVKMPQ
ncbi:MAG: DUF3365 domain-containing protein [Sphingobacteriales bacterium]|nr:DUF3365 domain-containing protein [Sphingobacteriales bacterium]